MDEKEKEDHFTRLNAVMEQVRLVESCEKLERAARSDERIRFFWDQLKALDEKVAESAALAEQHLPPKSDEDW